MEVISLIKRMDAARDKVPVATYSIPINYVDGPLRVSKATDGTYFSNSAFGQAFPADTLSQQNIILLSGGNIFTVKPIKLENRGSQFHYDIDGEGEPSETGMFIVEKDFPLYLLDEMPMLQKMKVTGIEAGIKQLRDQLNPLNCIYTTASVVYDLQKQINEYQSTPGDLVATDGQVKDDNWEAEQKRGIENLANATDLLVEAARSFDISPPISSLEYTVKAQALHISSIKALLGIPDGKSNYIENLTADQATQLQTEMIQKMNEAFNADPSKDLDDVVPEEVISEENKKKSTNPSGKDKKDNSNKKAGSSSDVSEPEPSLLTEPAEPQLVNSL